MISRFTQSQTLIRNTPQKHHNKNQQNQSNPNFKGIVEAGIGAGTGVLNFLNTNQAVGACFIDFFSMVLPRTLIDSSRGKDACTETAIREGSGTVNHAMAGLVGLGAGYLVSSAFNKANGVNSHLVFTNNEAIDVFGEFIKNSHTEGVVNNEKYYYDILKNMQGLNTTAGENVYKSLSDETAKEISKTLSNAKADKYKLPETALKEAGLKFIGETGSGSTIRLFNPSTGKYIEDSFENHVKNAHAMNKTFADKAKHEIEKGVQGLSHEQFLTKLKGLKKVTPLAGLAIPLAIGMGTQPLNRYLTKKRTGSDGFVGVGGNGQERKPDKSTGFKAAKIGLGLAMGSAMISTILKKPATLFKNPAKAFPEILSNLQYKGLIPTMNQFKFIYGMTIMSRIFAVRDKNEMRESAIKDSLGFANWLILGGFVSKLAAKAFNKGTVNFDEKTQGKGLWNYITKAVEKTHEEILYPELKKAGIKVVDEKGKAVPFRKLLGSLKDFAKQPSADKAAIEKALTSIKYKNYAQLLGYVYSGLVLGMGIAKLNIIITKWCEGKNQKPVETTNDKMKISNDFIKQNVQKDNKTFGAFLNAI